jgi:hypothetical protein
LSVATVLKSRWNGTPVMGLLALSAAILAALLLPGLAEAQEKDQAGMNTTVVEPGESLWAIAQGRLGPDATPQQVGAETERIYLLNRDRIGVDPNSVRAGQEILVSPAVVPSSAGGEESRANEEPAAASDTTERSDPTERTQTDAASPAERPPEEELPAGAPDEENKWSTAEPAEGVAAEPGVVDAKPEPSEPEGIEVGTLGGRRILGLTILLLTGVVAILMVWKLPMNRPIPGSFPHTLLQGHRRHYGELPTGYYDSYALPSPLEQRKWEAEVGTSTVETPASSATAGLAGLTEGEPILLSKAFLERCLEERLLGQDDPLILDPLEREFLELVAVSATFRDEIAVPKELLEAFLVKN